MPIPAGDRSTRVYRGIKKYIDKFGGKAKSALEALGNYTNELYTRDSNGNYPKYTNDSKDRLWNLYREAINEVKIAGQNDPSIKETSDEISRLMGLDVSLIMDIYPKGNHSLAEEVDKARVSIANARNKDFSVVGALSNKRYAMEIEKDNEYVKGFFTPERLLNKVDLKTILDGVNDYIKKSDSPKYTDAVVYCFDKAYGHVLSDKTPEDFVQEYFETHEINDGKTSAEQTRKTKELILDVTLNSPEETNKAIDSVQKAVTQYIFALDANPETNISNRNIAMSKLANLFGVPDILAKSEKLQVDYGDKLVNGVFMENAVGKSFESIMPEDAKKLSKQSFDNPNVLKQIAELQMLDYICQNVDRHQSNIFYQFSADGSQIIGIQGIDNDYSFGKTVPKDDEQIVSVSNTYDELRVVPESMKNKIMAVSPDMLKYVLSDLGLKDDETQAAADRLKKVQDGITAKKIEVLTDKDFENRTLESFKTKSFGNLYSRLNYVFGSIMNSAEINLKNKEEKEAENVKEFKFEKAEELNGISEAQLKNDSEIAADYLRQINASQKRIWGKGSPEFRNLKEALEDYKDFVDVFPKKPSYKEYLRMQAEIEKVSEKAKDYFVSKAKVKKPDAKMRDRIKLSHEIHEKFAERLEKFKQGLHHKDEIETEEMNAKLKANANKVSNNQAVFEDKKNELIEKGVNPNVADLQAKAFVSQIHFKDQANGDDYIMNKELNKEFLSNTILNDLILRERVQINKGNMDIINSGDYQMGPFEQMVANGNGKMLLDTIKTMNIVDVFANSMNPDIAKQLSEPGGANVIAKNALNELKMPKIDIHKTVQQAFNPELQEDEADKSDVIEEYSSLEDMILGGGNG